MRIQDLLREAGALEDTILEGDAFDIELDDLVIETTVLNTLPDGVVVAADETALAYLGINEDESEAKKWSLLFYTVDRNDRRMYSTKIFPSKESAEQWVEAQNKQREKVFVDSLKPSLREAKYQGRNVQLGKPMAGDVKKSKVYVKGPKGNVVKVNFGDKKMRIKKSNPARRKSFRARHNCANPGPRHKARYWSCKMW